MGPEGPRRKVSLHHRWAEGQQGVGFVAAGLFPERYEKTALMLLPPSLIEEYAWEKQNTSASTARTA